MCTKMMTRPDFMKKQVLFLESSRKNKLKFKNTNLVLVDENNKIILQHSLYRIFIVFIYGECSISSILIKKAKKFGITIVFLDYSLKPYFSIYEENIGNFLLRKKQYYNKSNLDLAKFIVENKIINQIDLMKSLRYKTKDEKRLIRNMAVLLNKISLAKNEDELLGIEGGASKIFFKVYFKNMGFKGRKPRVKTDIYNLLLDIGYYYLFNFIDANLNIYGFDTYFGFYHKLFFQRKSLVCDIMEPFRCIIDRRLRKSFNLKQINVKDFGYRNDQYFIKRENTKKYSKLFLKEILLFKQEIFLFIQSFYRNFIKDREISKYKMFLIKTKK